MRTPLLLNRETLKRLSDGPLGLVDGGGKASTGTCTVTWLGCPLTSRFSDCELKCFPTD